MTLPMIKCRFLFSKDPVKKCPHWSYTARAFYVPSLDRLNSAVCLPRKGSYSNTCCVCIHLLFETQPLNTRNTKFRDSFSRSQCNKDRNFKNHLMEKAFPIKVLSSRCLLIERSTYGASPLPPIPVIPSGKRDFKV